MSDLPRYEPAPAPLGERQLPEYVLRELRRIAFTFQQYAEEIDAGGGGAPVTVGAGLSVSGSYQVLLDVGALTERSTSTSELVLLAFDSSSSAHVKVPALSLPGGGGSPLTLLDVGAELFGSLTFTVSSNTVIVNFTAEVIDQAGYVSLSAAGTDRVTIPEDGWYVVTASARLDAVTGGTRGLWIQKNGNAASAYGAVRGSPSGSGYPTNLSTAILEYLVAGDYLRMALQSSTNVLAIPLASQGPRMTIHRIAIPDGGGADGPIDTSLTPRIGDSVIYDGAKWVALSPRNFHYLFEDFTFGPYETSGVGGWDQITSGTGAGVSMTMQTGAGPGAVLLSSGTSSSGYAGLMRALSATASASAGGYAVGRGKIIFRALVQLNRYIVSASNCFVRIGLMDELSGAPGQGIYFATDTVGGGGAYVDGSSNGLLFGAARDGTLTYGTIEAGAIAPVPDTWYLLEIIINAAGTQVDFYVDGTLVSVCTANIPSTNQPLWPALQVQNGSGVTTNANLRCDYVEIIQEVSRK